MRKTVRFQADTEGIGQAVAFFDDFLKDYGIRGTEYGRALLTAEEAIGSLAGHAVKGSSFTVSAKAMFGTVTVEIISEGTEYDLAKSMKTASYEWENDTGDTTQDALRNIILRAYANDLKYHHKAGRNSIRITVVRSRHAFLYRTLGAMLLAIIAGVILTRTGNPVFNETLSEYLLVPVKTMYMNALKMVVAPVVFFSIISCVVQFTDLSEMGRIGGKVLAFYLFTTMVAMAVGLGAFYLFQPGGAVKMGQLADTSSITSQTMNVSILDTIVGIVPSSFVQPFLDSRMLQLIFMAVLCGIAAGMIGKYSEMLRSLFEACNELFLKVTTLIIKVMPVAIFCSITHTILKMGLETLISVLTIFGTYLFALACMVVVYFLLVLLKGRLSPIPLLRKYALIMLQVFSMSSSNASIPINMEICEKKLGIGRKVYSLSIPLGATINMDGTCINLVVFSLAIAKAYGVEITGSAIFALVITIFVLSMGAPGIPGVGDGLKTVKGMAMPFAFLYRSLAKDFLQRVSAFSR